jgi:hypothetical protein
MDYKELTIGIKRQSGKYTIERINSSCGFGILHQAQQFGPLFCYQGNRYFSENNTAYICDDIKCLIQTNI